MTIPGTSHVARFRWMSDRVSRAASRCAAGIFVCLLIVSTAPIVHAAQNIYEKPAKARFQAAPIAPPTEAELAEAATAPTMILGVPANTIFFVTAGVLALLWFTLGGGRKPKVTRD